jgi:hypothetical protein
LETGKLKRYRQRKRVRARLRHISHNGPIHVGFEVDNVPIVDLPIVRVFFEGEIKDAALRTAEGRVETIAKRPLYKDAIEASQIAASYFQAAPQLDFIWKGIQDRWVPVARISGSDTPWAYLTYTCKPDFSHIATRLSERVDADESAMNYIGGARTLIRTIWK